MRRLSDAEETDVIRGLFVLPKRWIVERLFAHLNR